MLVVNVVLVALANRFLMLKLRLLTAIILIPLFVILVLKLPPAGFAIMTVMFVIIGAWEWSSFMGIKKKISRSIYSVFIFSMLPVSLLLSTFAILTGAVVGWLIALGLVLLYPRASHIWGKGRILRGLMGIFVLVPTWRALNYIRDTDWHGVDNGIYVLLCLCVLIWGADTGAYFAGKKFGKDKLAPLVSPGKTRQGLYGALLSTLILAVGGLWWFDLPDKSWLPLLLLSFVTVLFSVLGDLFESMLKRNVGIKDSGSIFPGHGGLLDRIDSLTAAAPVFALGMMFL
jgi:phosphatidate cytidylyltransferase